MINRLCFLLCLLTPLSLLANELPLPDDPHIVVNGQGYVEQVPDLIIARFEVSAVEKDFSTAKLKVDTIVGKALAAAKKLEVPEEQINASQISAAPQYDWQDNSRVYKGERVSRQVEIRLTEAEQYDDLVNGLLASGISSLPSIQLDFQDRKQLEQKALTAALDDARAQAEAIVGHLGSRIKSVYQIAPESQSFRIETMAMRADAAAKSEPAGLSLGKQRIEQRIRVVYLIK